MKNHFGSNIRYLRKIKNMSQDELAEKLGYKSFTTIQKWESGKSEPNLKKLNEISSIFNVDIDKLATTDLSVETTEYRSNITNREEMLLKSFSKLNDEGKEKAISYTQDLVDSGKYSIKVKEDNISYMPSIEEMLDYLKEIPMAAFDGKLNIYEMSDEDLYSLYKLIKENE